ncbi:MAG: hypothetical protein ACD_44C00417G0007 [uncultured bacterium]|nr:MAG: hypothetical protein ACD_44C00417G0007 [uncultured bacterium]OGT16529.1 MAG: hypothetical protein A3B69_03945 [Gammaproteobacteria bacterium RIFCSPHIGHO2_02_FULL_38_33]OGT24858.1 MAG: hypothetical protein A2W47_02110 [Gammaproteobacteria bacterium RIFCSPHIGHO2_12_38_15]OGT69475.1 MAG: hypothetical protein A3I12_02540 [Gammaproteobacteria bacterium RIFCSPLOWO2_02_FULL_38_11]OGT76907.1 MAG: hypothetical protein A3G71_05765 [Gammaproteobacteria bacterium RIFCSPLOWO2_12_FULL_38_14]
MKNIIFEWDPIKASINKQKHRITFEEAKTIFYDENAIIIHDPGHSDDEDRFVMLGLSAILRMLIVVHCYRKEEKIIRIISARKATKKELTYYGDSL